jgi:pimeloyl-ACP methyl ester carboxylesterase
MPYALNGGIRIHYEVRGEGNPIVLHTGGLGDLSVWENAGYVSGLQDYKCISIDPRGHGLSDFPENVAAHTVKSYVSDVIAVLDQLGVYRTSFFGYSDGGRVGFELCAVNPGRITALITLGSCVDPEKESSIQLANFLRERGIDAYINSAELEEHLKFPGWLRENFLKSDPEMFALEVEGFSTWGGAKALAPRIRTPALILSGSLEDPNSDCQKIVNYTSAGAQLAVLRNLGHIGAFLHSEAVLPHVRDFLSRIQFGLDRRYS